MAKKPNLQAALMEQTEIQRAEERPSAKRPIAVANNAAAAPSGRQASRIGKKQISAWLNPDFDRSLLLILAKSASGTDKQKLIAEALNDLFRKHDVPVVRE